MRHCSFATVTAWGVLVLAAAPANAAAPIYVAGDETGIVDVFNGAGARLSTFHGSFTADDRLAVGDVTGDGEDDLLIAGDRTGTIDIFDQEGFRPTPKFNGSYTFGDGFAAGNVRGDGRDEILVAGDVTGTIDVFSATGAKLASFNGHFTEDDALAAGDVTGDAFDEILVAGDVTGTIDVFNGTGAKVASFNGHFTEGDGFAAGNVTGDGKDEILVAGDVTGVVDVFNAAGSKLTSFNGHFTESDALGSGDVAGDAYDEVVIGGDETGTIDVFSGTGGRVASFHGTYTSGDGFAVGRNGEFDIDGDSLLDSWETTGIDANGDGTVDLDLPSFGADPRRKNLFIEADYMAGHAPRNDAINDVVTAFANASVPNPDGTTGITLRVDVDEQLAHQDTISVWGDFDTIKAAAFGSPAQRASSNAANILAAKRRVYHYTAYVHAQNHVEELGKAEVGGNDFVVSLGSSRMGTDGTGHIVGTRLEQTAVLMHEIGHNLGLRHGGGDTTNCKPNYLSVMNYTFAILGIVRKDVIGPRFDYSGVALAPLQEGSLSENAGIGDGTDFTIWDNDGARPAHTGIGNGPLDWDGDGSIDAANVTVDVNNLNITGCRASPGQTLNGFDDWSNLDYNFREHADFADDLHSPSPDEITAGDAQIIEQYWHDLFSPDLKVTKTVDKAEAIPGDVLTYTVAVKNVGPGAATAVELVDALPNGSTETRTIGALAPGSTAIKTFTYTVPLQIVNGTVLTNVATVTGANLRGAPEENLANNSDRAETVVHTHCTGGPIGGNPIVCYWLGEPSGSTQLVDKANAHDGSCVNNATAGLAGALVGDPDTARGFNGTAAYCYANGIAAPTDAYTIEGWARLAAQAPGTIAEHGGSGGIYVTTSSFCMRNAWETLCWMSTPSVGQWHHVAGTWSASDATMRLYVDGVLRASRVSGAKPSGVSTFYVGYGQSAPWFKGTIDEVAYYPTALSPTRIAAHYHTGCAC